MALQGTLDTFALPDVLRLLGTTRKTGRLDLEGDRGRGAAWVDGGLVVSAEAGRTTEDLAEALFELLRFTDGTFNFDTAAIADDAPEGVEVEELLARAEEMLAEWRAIESVVPSLDLQVVLRRDLPSSHVKIDRDSWRTIATIGAGTTVRRLGEDLGVGELGVCRSVKALVENGVVELHETPETIEAEDAPAADETDVETEIETDPEPVAETDQVAQEDAVVETEPAVESEPMAETDAAVDATWPADEPGTGSPVEWFERWREDAATEVAQPVEVAPPVEAAEVEPTVDHEPEPETEPQAADDEAADPDAWFDREPAATYEAPEPVETNDSLWDRLDALREAFDESERLEASLAAADAPEPTFEAEPEAPAATPSLPGDPTVDLFSTPAQPAAGETSPAESDGHVDRAALLKFLSSVKR